MTLPDARLLDLDPDDDAVTEDGYHDPDHYYAPEDWNPAGEEEDG